MNHFGTLALCYVFSFTMVLNPRIRGVGGFSNQPSLITVVIAEATIGAHTPVKCGASQVRCAKIYLGMEKLVESKVEIQSSTGTKR